MANLAEEAATKSEKNLSKRGRENLRNQVFMSEIYSGNFYSPAHKCLALSAFANYLPKRVNNLFQSLPKLLA